MSDGEQPIEQPATKSFGRAETFVMGSMIIGMMFLQTIVSPRTGSGSS